MLRGSSFALLATSLTLFAALAPGCGGDGGDAASTSSSSGGGDDGDGGSSGEGGSAPSSTSTGSTGAGTPLVVVNWNVRNFFDTEDDPSTDQDLVPTSSEYEAKVGALAAVLRELNPDVAVLQEVENETVLQDLAERVDPAYTAVELVEGNDFRGIDIGAISKIPFDSVVSHKDDSFSLPGGGPETFTRDCPEFHITHAGKKIILLGVHFRSKGGDDDPDRRLAEAIQSRAIADSLAGQFPEAGIAILGDYNDLPGSDPVEYIRTGPPAFLDAVDSVPEADRWTFDFQGTLELIDHQMSNPIMAAWLDPASVSIRHGADITAAGDHSPVRAVYNVQ